MCIGSICVTSYLVIGFVLSLYWFKRDYSKEYEECAKSGTLEKGVTEILLLLIWVFWPINMIKNVIKYNKI
jgi:hypothetical protein